MSIKHVKSSCLLANSYIKPVQYGLASSEYQFTTGYVGFRSSWPKFAIHQTLYEILAGTIGSSARAVPQDLTLLDGTRLVEDTPFPANGTIRKPRENLRELIEELSRNVTLSLQSVDGLIYLKPAAITMDGSEFTNVFQYNRRTLFITYGAMLGLGLLAQAIGVLSFYRNGVGVVPGFLLFAMTTRNKALDSIFAGYSLGSEDVPEDVKKVEVKYGGIRPEEEDGLSAHAGFGFDEQIEPLKFGKQYF